MTGKTMIKGAARWFGRCVWRVGKAGFVVALIGALVLGVAVYAVDYDVALMSPDRGGALLVTDRHGQVLRSVPGRGNIPGRWHWVTLDELPPQAVAAVIESEDGRFFSHKGVDPLGVLRAVALNLAHGRLAYGGSTITMQLVKQIHSPGKSRNIINKIRESVYALRLERAMDKRQILEQYLNRVYYGNGAWGLEAAARTYFGKSAAALSVGEATLLAVIPRGPAYYNPLRHLGRTVLRRDHVLALMVRKGVLTEQQARRARQQKISLKKQSLPFAAPHFVDWVLTQLPAEVKGKGGVVKTTLDLALQRQLETSVARHVQDLSPRRLTQASMVVLDTKSGAVRAMVGSADYRGQNGQINGVTRRRHPGSALKPFVYALALEAGDSPASVTYDILDVPSAYRATSLTQPEHGPVRYRQALANSYNLAAIHVLEKVGVEALVSRLRLAGVPVVQDEREVYGLRLALGSAKVRLLDLAAAYGFVANRGVVVRPEAVTRVEHGDGDRWYPKPPKPTTLYSEQTAWLTMHMLADPQARRPAFGQELPVDLPFKVAFKTGTARGFADTVAIGVTEQYTVAAWAGNFDGKPTHGVVAMNGAAPLVREGLLTAGKGANLTLPKRPERVVDVRICPLSGKIAGKSCPHARKEVGETGKTPKKSCSWHAINGEINYPAAIRSWAKRTREAGGRKLAQALSD